MSFREYNFDGLVGPTHNYAGLGTGNLASMASKHHVSSPKAAALEGLAKMKLLAEMGVPQAILPPQRRPHVGYLRMRYAPRPAGVSPAPGGRAAGVSPAPDATQRRQDACVTDPADWITERPKIDEVAALLRAAAENGEEGRRDLAIASSASAMWAANAATVSPSPDTADGRLHITPANLVSQPHRALEAAERWRLLAHMFGDMMRFDVHPPLSQHNPDEGAANHTRLAREHGRAGAEVFTFGVASSKEQPGRFHPRQHKSASAQIASQHSLFWNHVNYVTKQSRDAIDAGVFHNDVICVGNGDVLLIHERAWCAATTWDAGLRTRWSAFNVPCAEPRTIDLKELFSETHAILGLSVRIIELSETELPLLDAVKSYLFNSQLVTLPDGSMALIYPAECEEVPSAKAAIERILREDNPVEHAVRVDVRQSMKNGGGPACLRLRVVLSDEERAAVRGNVFWTPQLHETLVAWVNRHYRETLTPRDLADVRLYEQSMAALDELAEILDLPI